MLELDVDGGSWATAQGASALAPCFQVLATGDVCPARGHVLDRRLSAGPKEAADVWGDVLPELRRKDLSVMNLEATLSEQGAAAIKEGPVLQGPSAAVEGLAVAGFDVVTMANNHAMDMGPQALLDTQEQLRQRGMTVVGAGRDLHDARRLVVVERHGVRVGVLAFADCGFGAATATSAGIATLEGPSESAVRAAREQCDLLLVFVHGGHEYCTFPSPGTVMRYRALAEAGADAVIGHHPHVVQGMELHRGVPILYSLGNFLFWADAREVFKLWWVGIVVRLHFQFRSCTRVDVHPVAMNRRTGTLALLKGQRRRCLLAWCNHLSRLIADPERHERLWQSYCATRLGQVLTTSMQCAREIMAAREDSPARRLRAAELQALFACQAHREVAAGALESVRRGTACEELFQGDEVYALTRSSGQWKRRRIAPVNPPQLLA